MVCSGTKNALSLVLARDAVSPLRRATVRKRGELRCRRPSIHRADVLDSLALGWAVGRDPACRRDLASIIHREAVRVHNVHRNQHRALANTTAHIARFNPKSLTSPSAASMTRSDTSRQLFGPTPPRAQPGTDGMALEPRGNERGAARASRTSTGGHGLGL